VIQKVIRRGHHQAPKSYHSQLRLHRPTANDLVSPAKIQVAYLATVYWERIGPLSTTCRRLAWPPTSPFCWHQPSGSAAG